MSRRLLLPLIAAFATAVGCFNSHNPGYFPYELPGGPIQQTHAKPRFGFFRDFDPKAAKLNVTPTDATAPLGSQIVLVATVCDKDGNPRRSRRVEWVLEGPGNIIEVDEAGFYAGRGYKVDNKFGVTYTGYLPHCITRGNDDPKDDVDIAPGQTFCVVSSAVPGESTITAYAPGVFNWERGRVITRIVWGDGRFGFPPPAVVRYGTETTLSTSLAQVPQDGPNPPIYRVRYKVLDGAGAPAVLAPVGATGTSLSQAGIGAKEAEEPLDATTAAVVRLVQTSPQAGKTRVAVEVVKAADNGIGPGTVVSRRETVIEWAAPTMRLDMTAPASAGPNASVPVVVTLANAGLVDARESTVRVTLSDGATLDRSDPPPVRQENDALIFNLPAVPSKQEQALTLQVHPAKLGSFTVKADASTADGLQGHKEATTRIENGRLVVVVEGPSAALLGEKAPLRVAVTNAGATSATNVKVSATLDAALQYGSGKNPVELAAGTIAPGQTQVVELPVSAKAAGHYGVKATATADGNITAASEPFAFDYRRAELQATVDGPKLAYLGQDFAWSIVVSNNGDGPISNVLIRATLPAEVKLKDAGDARIGSGPLEWRLDSLKAGEQKTLKVTVDAVKFGDKATLAVLATADAGGSDAAPVGDPLQAKFESSVAIIGTPALTAELVAPMGFLSVGKNAVFQVRVKNSGTLPARNIDVSAAIPAELKLVRATGAANADGRTDASGNVTFPTLDQLNPGATATFTIEVQAIQTGDARMQTQVKATSLTAPLKEEQAVRVVGK